MRFRTLLGDAARETHQVSVRGQKDGGNAAGAKGIVEAAHEDVEDEASRRTCSRTGTFANTRLDSSGKRQGGSACKTPAAATHPSTNAINGVRKRHALLRQPLGVSVSLVSHLVHD